jgi:hypothetical protein
LSTNLLNDFSKYKKNSYAYLILPIKFTNSKDTFERLKNEITGDAYLDILCCDFPDNKNNIDCVAYEKFMKRLYPEHKYNFDKFETLVNGVKFVRDKNGVVYIKFLFGGGTFSPLKSYHDKLSNATTTAEKLFKMDRDVLNGKGNLIKVCLTVPHNEFGCSLDKKYFSNLIKLFIERFRNYLCERKGLDSNVYELAFCINFHYFGTKNPFSKHPHIHMHILNMLINKDNKEYFLFNPELKKKELKDDELEDVKRIWRNILMEFGIIEDCDIKPYLRYDFIKLKNKNYVKRSLAYASKLYVTELAKHLTHNDVDFNEISDEKIAWLRSILLNRNKRICYGKWAKLNKLIKADGVSVCYEGKKIQRTD